MAGAKVEIEVDNAAALAALQGAQNALRGAGLHATLEDIGEYMLRATRESAAEEVSPDGLAWPALSPRYARRKAKLRPGLPMLKFDNHMLGDRLSYQVDDAGGAVYIGTSAPQGATQHFGRGAIPPRPWLGVNDADAEEILAIVHDHLAAPFGAE